MTLSPLDHALARLLRAGATPDDLAGRWGLRPDDARTRAEAAGWVPEQLALDLRPPGLRSRTST